MKEECGNCNAGFFALGADGQRAEVGLCQAHPPTSTVLLVPIGKVQIDWQPQPMSSLPTVTLDGWCREWAAEELKLEH